MSQAIPFLTGSSSALTEPLGRYLPPIPEGVVTAWLQSQTQPGSLILDPFGTSPRLAVEAARAGYRVLVIAYNPLIRFLIDLTASPPSKTALQAALADLGASPRGNQRLEAYIQSHYQTVCGSCDRIITADAFIWERSASQPAQRVYHCPHCGDKGEYPVTREDNELASHLSGSAMHRARALERVAALDDPDRIHVEDALSTYLPRSIFLLLTLINRIDNLPAQHGRALRALLLLAFDQANTLWHYPAIRYRPRQLTTPLHFVEKNIWLALENAVETWAEVADGYPSVPFSHWPELPPPGGGITIFEGRLKELAENSMPERIQAVLAPLPRPNQAFWTYSTLWTGWLWGRSEAAPYKVGLRRRRYDWGWHTQALEAAFSNCLALLHPGTPILGLIGEIEPGFISAALLSTRLAGIALAGTAIRAEQGQAQMHWTSPDALQSPATHNAPEATGQARADLALPLQMRTAIRQHLLERGEPAPYVHMHTAALQSAVEMDGHRGFTHLTPAEAYDQTQSAVQAAMAISAGFIRFAGSEHGLEVGKWWLAPGANEQAELPLADRIEMEVVRYLIKNPERDFSAIDAHVCESFPGLFTPDQDFILACLESYAVQSMAQPNTWRLRTEDEPSRRRAELAQIQELLIALGRRLGYQPEVIAPNKVYWGAGAQVFYILASAIISTPLALAEEAPNQCILVCPGSRASLILAKLQDNPMLQEQLDRGWQRIKFRLVRQLSENNAVNRDNLDEQLASDRFVQKNSRPGLF